MEVLSSLDQFIEQTRVLYQTYWLTPEVLVPVSLVVHVSVFAFCVRLVSNGDIVRESFLEAALFHLPGGLDRQVAHLGHNIFPGWYLSQGSEVPHALGDYTSDDFARAVRENDRKQLRKIAKSNLGSWWVFWLVKPLVSFLLALILPIVAVPLCLWRLAVYFWRRYVPQPMLNE